MRFKIAFVAIAALLLAACQTPQEAVFAARGTHNELLRLSVAYAERPSCAQPMPSLVCARVDIVRQIDSADDIAAAALDRAEVLVRTPGFGDNVYETAAQTATAAVAAFSAIMDMINR